RLDGTIAGFNLSLPIFLVHPAGSNTAIELRFCAPPLTGSSGQPVTSAPIHIDELVLFLSDIALPTGSGSFLWHAYVTPQTQPTGPADDSATYELRALVPVPHRLTVTGRYERVTHDAVLTGRLTEVDKPQARAEVLAASESTFE